MTFASAKDAFKLRQGHGVLRSQLALAVGSLSWPGQVSQRGPNRRLGPRGSSDPRISGHDESQRVTVVQEKSEEESSVTG